MVELLASTVILYRWQGRRDKKGKVGERYKDNMIIAYYLSDAKFRN